MTTEMKTYIMYEIVCNDINIKYNYVGHTTNFRSRKLTHKKRCHNQDDIIHYKCKLYTFIRDNGGMENWNMRPLEEYKCENVIQARIREQYWIDKNEATLNSLRAYVSTEQEKEEGLIRSKLYYDSNKEQISAKTKIYCIKNKEHIALRQKQYTQDNKEHILEKRKQYCIDNKEHIFNQTKEYAIKNKERLSEYHQNYRKNHKEQTAERARIKTTCECGSSFNLDGRARHYKSNIHQLFKNKI